MTVGVKEMIHRIFKAIVPHTNKHNLELALLQQVNTLQTLRYLANGGSDDQEQQNISIFADMIIDSKLRLLLSGWCIDNQNLSIYNNHHDDSDEESSNDDIEYDGKVIF